MKEFRNKTYFEDSISLPPGKSQGIQLGNYSDGPELGTREESYGWRDITSDISVRGVVASDPTFTQVGSTAFRFYRFAIGKFVWLNFHVPHDLYVPPSGNASVFFHVHWFVDDSASPTSGAVTWQWTFAYARGFNQDPVSYTHLTLPTKRIV